MRPEPQPFDRQLAEERARHPSAREAARAGAQYGLLLGFLVLAFGVVDRFLPGSPPRWATPVSWRRVLVADGSTLALTVLISLLLAELGAAIIRWRRRMAARLWFPDRAV